jgi:hypothetical protein
MHADVGTLGNPGHGIEVIQHPMHPRAPRRIRVIHDEGEGDGSLGNPLDRERWGHVLAVTGVAEGYPPPVDVRA